MTTKDRWRHFEMILRVSHAGGNSQNNALNIQLNIGNRPNLQKNSQQTNRNIGTQDCYFESAKLKQRFPNLNWYNSIIHHNRNLSSWILTIPHWILWIKKVCQLFLKRKRTRKIFIDYSRKSMHVYSHVFTWSWYITKHKRVQNQPEQSWVLLW